MESLELTTVALPMLGAIGVHAPALTLILASTAGVGRSALERVAVSI